MQRRPLEQIAFLNTISVPPLSPMPKGLKVQLRRPRQTETGPECVKTLF
jgi:hypothetical protein